jgi:hypothetical protein
MVTFRVLSRTNLAYRSRHSTLNSRPFNLLQPLVSPQKSQLLCNQANPASFCKIPGVGVHNTSVPSFASVVICATWHLYPLCPHSIAHTSRHHGGVGSASSSRHSPRVTRRFPRVLCFHTRLPRSARGTNPFSRNPFPFTSIQIPRGFVALCVWVLSPAPTRSGWQTLAGVDGRLSVPETPLRNLPTSGTVLAFPVGPGAFSEPWCMARVLKQR